MKRVYVPIILLTIALGAGCADKLLAAKTAVGFISIGVETARSIVKEVAATKRAECNKQCAGKTGDDLKQCESACFGKTQKMLDATDKLWPQLAKTFDLIAAALKENRDATELIKKSVCLAADLAGWIPDKYRKKIDRWLALASAFTCDKGSVRVPIEEQRRIAAALRVLLIELGAGQGA